MTKRIERVGEMIRHEVGRIILHELNDPRIGFVTLTRVEVSADLSLAKVFVSILETNSRQRTTLRGLSSARRRIEALLRQNLRMRRTPEISFHLDQGVKHSIRMSSILAELERERSSRTAAEALPAGEGQKDGSNDS